VEARVATIDSLRVPVAVFCRSAIGGTPTVPLNENVKSASWQVAIGITPGRGASIKVILPASQTLGPVLPTTDTAEPSRQVVPGLRGKSILVVDDEDGIRELVSEGLAARGMAVETVGTCEEALTLLGLRQFDVILCDYNLPGLSGEELFSRLSVSSGGIASRFVFMTGDLLDSAAHASFGLRGVRALQKPFQLSGLATLLSEVLEAQPAQAS
jgi:CheY-like chemotaxis protein